MTRFLVSHDSPEITPTLRHVLDDPRVAGFRLCGPAVADGEATRRLAAAIHGVGSPEPRSAAELPRLVAVDPADLPHALAPPAVARQARDLASGGEAMDVTLEVLEWARRLAGLGVDLVFLDWVFGPTKPGVTAAWLEALHAAGLIAVPGPLDVRTLQAEKEAGEEAGEEAGKVSAGEVSETWSAVGALLAHGAEALRLEESAEPLAYAVFTHLREEKAVGAVLVGTDPKADLVELDQAPGQDDVAESEVYSAGDRRVDRLRLEWLV